MSHPQLKDRAINLRKQGLSYSEILAQVPVAKSTISAWLHSVGLAKHQKQRLTQMKIEAQKRGAAARRAARLQLTREIHQKAMIEARKLRHDPLWLAGTILYWAEGTKEKLWRPSERVSFINMEVRAILLFRRWLFRYCSKDEASLNYAIYIHEDADIERAKSYWSDNLKIEIARINVYLKRHNLSPHRKNINAEYHGVMKIQVYQSTQLLRRIAGWIDAVVEYLH
jgi:hypothetical protein